MPPISVIPAVTTLSYCQETSRTDNCVWREKEELVFLLSVGFSKSLWMSWDPIPVRMSLRKLGQYDNINSGLFVLKVDSLSSLGTEKAILFAVQMHRYKNLLQTI